MERVVGSKGEPAAFRGVVVICLWCDRLVTSGWVFPKTHVNGGYGGICEGTCGDTVATKLMEAA